jgi:hypothetical protein
MEILVNHPDVDAFVTAKTGAGFGPHSSIGLVEDGTIKAGVVYADWNGSNIFMHVAAEPGVVWLTRGSLYTFFAYPFIQCGCRRVTGWVEASNMAARELDEHLGFVEEARLKQAARDGGDVILYAMTKDQCRFLGDRYARFAQ